LYGAFVWARRALTSQKPAVADETPFSPRAVACRLEIQRMVPDVDRALRLLLRLPAWAVPRGGVAAEVASACLVMGVESFRRRLVLYFISDYSYKQKVSGV
jgi:hypothetical protein